MANSRHIESESNATISGCTCRMFGVKKQNKIPPSHLDCSVILPWSQMGLINWNWIRVNCWTAPFVPDFYISKFCDTLVSLNQSVGFFNPINYFVLKKRELLKSCEQELCTKFKTSFFGVSEKFREKNQNQWFREFGLILFLLQKYFQSLDFRVNKGFEDIWKSAEDKGFVLLKRKFFYLRPLKYKGWQKIL